MEARLRGGVARLARGGLLLLALQCGAGGGAGSLFMYKEKLKLRIIFQNVQTIELVSFKI